MNRRRYLGAVGCAAFMAAAGCSESNGNGNSDSNGASTEDILRDGEDFDGQGSSDFSRLNRLTANKVRVTADEQITANIPTDYPTLQDAVDDISQLALPSTTVVNLNIEAGHNPTSGVAVKNGYFGNMRITADNDPLKVDSADYTGPFLEAHGAVAPTLATSVDFRKAGYDGTNIKTGIPIYYGYVEQPGAVGAIEKGVTLSNASYRFISLFQGSKLRANRVTLDQCDEDRAIHVTHGSEMSFAGSDCFNAANTGIYASHDSKINCRDVTVSGAGGEGLSAAESAAISCGGNISITNCDTAAVARRASTITLGVGAVEDCRQGVHAFTNSSLSLDRTDIIGVNGDAIYLTRGSTFGGRNFTVQQSADGTRTPNNGIWASVGSRAGIEDVTLSDATFDLRVNHGSRIGTRNCKYGSTNVSPNEVHPEGVIFDESDS